MSYLDPQSWDDVDAGGNPLDWMSRENKLWYPAYEMIRRAGYDRWAVLGKTPGNLIFVPDRTQGTIYRDIGTGFQSVPLITRFKFLIGSLFGFSSFQSVASTYNMFMNYNLFPQWEGATWQELRPVNGIFPLASWTSDALSEDGVPGWGDPEDTTMPKATVSLNAYELLRRCRWVFRAWQRYEHTDIRCILERRGGTGNSLANAQADWNANSWESFNSFGGGFTSAYAGNVVWRSHDTWTVMTVRARYLYDMLHLPEYAGTHKMHIFHFFTAPGDTTYSNPDYSSAVEDTWSQIYEDTEPVSIVQRELLINHKPDNEYFTISAPNTGWILPLEFSSFLNKIDHRVAIEYDIPGGLRFMAPLPA